VDTVKPENRRVPVEPLRVSRNGKRFFSEAHKQAVVEKCLVPGVSVSAVALAHGFNTNLVRKWIVKHQAARAFARTAGTLLPVSVIEAPATSARSSRRAADKRAPELASGWIEIEIGAARVILRGKVEAGQLRVVLEALGAWR
jgi:transposase